MNASEHITQRSDAERKTKTPSRAQAPWPDHKARAEMSEAELACNTVGKHGKNADWQRKW